MPRSLRIQERIPEPSTPPTCLYTYIDIEKLTYQRSEPRRGSSPRTLLTALEHPRIPRLGQGERARARSAEAPSTRCGVRASPQSHPLPLVLRIVGSLLLESKSRVASVEKKTKQTSYVFVSSVFVCNEMSSLATRDHIANA